MSEVESLAKCNEALKKGLITQADYDEVKKAYLRIEQIKLGFEGGLITGAEKDKVKVSRCRDV